MLVKVQENNWSFGDHGCMRTGSGHSWGDEERHNSFLVRMGCNHLHFFQPTKQGVLNLVDEAKRKIFFQSKKWVC